MALMITARHCELSSAVRERAAKKVEKMAKYLSVMTGAHLVVTREKSRYEAELVIAAKRLRIVGKALSMDPATAVEDAVLRVTQQLRKDHARRQDQRVRKAKAWAKLRKSGPTEVEVGE